MRSKAAGEEAVAIGVMQNVATSRSSRYKRSGHQLGPVLNIAARVTDDCWFARGSRRSMNANDLIQWLGEQTVRIVVTHVLLERKWQTLQVV